MATTGALYELVKTKGDSEMAYYALFVLRRVLYILMALKLDYLSL